MTSLSPQDMKAYLGRSISSLNKNKLRGLLAEVAFREHLASLGFADRVSAGGWLARSVGDGHFGRSTFVLFPEIIVPGNDYGAARKFEPPPNRLHSICAVFQQIGIESYYCQPTIKIPNDAASVEWSLLRLGVPTSEAHRTLSAALSGLTRRSRPYKWLRYHTDASLLPEVAVAEEFSKESLRVVLQSEFMIQISDVDGVLWGKQYTYPLEIKEKTASFDRGTGSYFGIDLGPFVKLAFYAAKQGNLKSLFVVREIDNQEDRNLLDWWFVTFETLARFASWIPRSGGKGMSGGTSTVVMIPKDAFSRLDATALSEL